MPPAEITLDAIRAVRARVEVSLADARGALQRSGGDVAAAVRSLMSPEQAGREARDAAIARVQADAARPSLPASIPSSARTPATPGDLRDWIAGRIEASAPDPKASIEGSGATVQSLATAVMALESDRGAVFGLQPGAEVFALARPLAARGRALLDAWAARWQAAEGASGADAVRSMAARAGIAMEPGDDEGPAAWPEPDASRAALAQLAETMAATDACTAHWRSADRLVEEGDRVVVRTARVDLARLRAYCRVATTADGLPLPRFYVRLMSRHDGLAVSLEPAEGPVSGEVEVGELGQALIWPLDTYRDHRMLSGVGLRGIDVPFVFGGLADSGFLAFDRRPGKDAPEDAPVFWVPEDFATESVVRLGDTMTGFIERLCAHRLSLPGVLREAGVPGWG